MFVTKQIGVLGLSQGGKIVPQVALRTSDVEYIVLMAAPGLGMKDFACLSRIALARVSGFNERDFDHIRELYDVLWPLYVKPKLSSSEITTAKQLLAQIASFMDEGSSAILNVSDVDGYFAFMRSHHVLDSVDDDPAETLKKLKCPVLAITGSKDVQVPAKEHLAVIEKASMEGLNNNFQVTELAGLNHTFQTCRTGLPIEYLTSEEAMAPEALNLITDWIINVTDSIPKL